MRLRHVAALLLGIILLGLALVWSQRVSIADNYITRELAAQGVRATYRLEQIGPRTQRVRDVVLGDPARPDMTARLVEIEVAYGGFRPRVTRVWAQGVRLYGRYDETGLHLGEIDKFRSGATGGPVLPDLAVSLSDARARIETPAGPVGLVLNGQGNLRSGFSGRAAALIRNIDQAGCRIPRASLWGRVVTTGGAVSFEGPVRAGDFTCGSSLRARAVVAATVARWNSETGNTDGRIHFVGKELQASSVTVTQPDAMLFFDGRKARWSGRVALAAAEIRASSSRTGLARVEGNWSARTDAPAGVAFDASGLADIRDLRAGGVQALRSRSAAFGDTPLGPLATRFADALAALDRGNRLTAAWRASGTGAQGRAELRQLAFDARSGARLRQSADSRIGWEWPSSRLSGGGGLTMDGGGFPHAALRIQQGAAGALSVQAFVDPYVAGKARLALDTVYAAMQPDGRWSVKTALHMDGPLPDGGLRGLELPLAFRSDKGGNWLLNPGCTPVRWDGVATAGLALAPARLSLCADGPGLITDGAHGMTGGGRINALALNGRLGETPLAIRSSSARFSVRRLSVALSDMAVVLGRGADPIRLSASRIDATPGRSGWGGGLAGVKARIGSIPILVDDGDARWTFAGGRLALAGPIRIIDDANPDRFNPLMLRDFTLAMANGRITANGTLTLPRGSPPIASVDISHHLSSGVGHADLTLPPLRFGADLQPDEISHVALGVIANVQGTVSGAGHIRWNGSRVQSDGVFRTDNTDLAAAFGPVSGLATEIRFTDLVGLVTAPGQVMTIKNANPGVEVRDGEVRYALLPGQRVAVEGGHWPFAGGDLNLLPSVMDFSAERPRNLTFQVVGLDAGSFINTLELENISATGTFDGLLPMVFDAQGGRIVGGILVARQKGASPLIIDHVEGLSVPCDRTKLGGNLSYVGAVSNEQLGRFGKLAFDALKDLQYKCLSIWMDGALDGEVVTQVSFNGVNRGELSSVPKLMSRQFTGLPFIFNITIAAPFRGLINTARSFVDPGLLIRSHLGDQFAPVPKNGDQPSALAVQPSESDNALSGGPK